MYLMESLLHSVATIQALLRYDDTQIARADFN